MRIAGIMVTFGCGAQAELAVDAALSQVETLYLADNGADAPTRQALQRAQVRHGGRLQLTLNPKNLGLAAAQNQCLRRALEDGAEWLLLLDDDSRPEGPMAHQLLAVAEPWSGIVAPRVIDRMTNRPARYITPLGRFAFRRREVAEGGMLREAAIVISSGSLVRAEVPRSIGGMSEELFIDYVDYDFCLRAKAAGFRILVSGNACLWHRLGFKRDHQALGMRVTTSNHAAPRRYTIFRNRMFILRRYGRRYPFLIAHESLAYFWDVARILVLENEKAAKLRSAARGFYDGCRLPLPKDTPL